MKSYDPSVAPDPERWRALGEDEALWLVQRYHRSPRCEHPRAPNPRLHAAIHVIVENQAAMGEEVPVAATIERLMAEGLSRHDAVHAVGSVLAAGLFDILKGGGDEDSFAASYYEALPGLTAESWRQSGGDEQLDYNDFGDEMDGGLDEEFDEDDLDEDMGAEIDASLEEDFVADEDRGDGLVELDDIVAALCVPVPGYPAGALRAAERARGRINQRLIDLVAKAYSEVLAGREPPDNAHIFAMLLLAEFEEKRAFPVIASLFTLPEHGLHSIVGDFLTEDLPRVLASVCSGHIDELAQIVEDRSRYEYVRSAALSAVAALVQRGVVTRDAAANYLRLLIHERLEREPSAVWDEVGSIVLDLYREDLFEEVRNLIRSGLTTGFALHPSDVDRTRREGRDRARARFESNPHLQPVRDVVAETKWWACFQEADDVATLDDGEEDHDYDHACDDPHCGHEGVTLRRESPKVGRNDPCPCGSGKKYKKCCLV